MKEISTVLATRKRDRERAAVDHRTRHGRSMPVRESGGSLPCWPADGPHLSERSGPTNDLGRASEEVDSTACAGVASATTRFVALATMHFGVACGAERDQVLL